MKIVISNSDYVYKIRQLIHLAEINFLVCQKIYKDYLNEKGRHENAFFVLVANNSFNESLSVLQTLICSTQKNDLRIKPILEKIIQEEDSLVYIDSQIQSQFIHNIQIDYPYLDEATFYGYKTFLLKANEPDQHLGIVMANIRRKKRVESGLTDFQELKEKFERFGFHKIRHHQIGHKHQDLKEPAGSVELMLQDFYISNLEEIIKDLKIKSYFWFDCSFDNPNYSIINSLNEIIKSV